MAYNERFEDENLGRIRAKSWVGSLMGVLLGGNLNNGASAGLFYFNSNNAPSNANWNYGASHSYGGIRNFRINALTAPLDESRKIGRKKHRSVG